MANGLADVYLASIAQSYTYAALLFFAVPLALSLWFFHQLFGSQYRYGEVLVFSLYVVGHLLLVTGILVPIAANVFPAATAFVGPTVYFVFLTYAHHGFFAKGFAPRAITWVSLAISLGMFLASIVGVFVVSLIVTVWFKSLAG